MKLHLRWHLARYGAQPKKLPYFATNDYRMPHSNFELNGSNIGDDRVESASKWCNYRRLKQAIGDGKGTE